MMKKSIEKGFLKYAYIVTLIPLKVRRVLKQLSDYWSLLEYSKPGPGLL